VSRGPWEWSGKKPTLFFRSGRLHTPWGSGTWGLAGEAIVVSLGTCGMWRLTFNDLVTTFTAAAGRGVGVQSRGRLAESAPAEAPPSEDAEAVVSAWTSMSDPIVTRLIGTGPWAWQGVAPFAFLRDGTLHTPWGSGRWGAHTSAPNTIFANFVGEEHVVTFDDCWSFNSVRKRDGDKAAGGALLAAEAKECPELTYGY